MLNADFVFPWHRMWFSVLQKPLHQQFFFNNKLFLAEEKVKWNSLAIQLAF